MTIAVLVQQPQRPQQSLPPLPSPFTITRHTWTSWDGEVFDLSDIAGGIVLGEQLEGLLPLPHERYTSTSPARAGSRSRGGRDLERPVFWTVAVYSDRSSAEWLERHRRFWRSMDRRRPGVWTVHTLEGQSRSLVCRFVRVTEPSLRTDPLAAGEALYGVELVADEQPYWRGRYEPAVFDLGGDVGADFIPPEGAPAFNVVQASTIAGATVENPGDVLSWPVWTVLDDARDVVLGVGADLIGLGIDLVDGDVLRIDTRRQATTLNGERVRGILTPHDFAPIPARSTMPLNITATGTGRIRVDVEPLYEGAL